MKRRLSDLGGSLRVAARPWQGAVGEEEEEEGGPSSGQWLLEMTVTRAKGRN